MSRILNLDVSPPQPNEYNEVAMEKKMQTINLHHKLCGPKEEKYGNKLKIKKATLYAIRIERQQIMEFSSWNLFFIQIGFDQQA